MPGPLQPRGGAGGPDISAQTAQRLKEGVKRLGEKEGVEYTVVFPDGFEVGADAAATKSSVVLTPAPVQSKPDDEYVKVLFEAVKANNFQALKLVFVDGLHDINCKDKHGLGLLHHVQAPTMAKWLVERGAVVDESDNPFGYTPLHTAKNALMALFFLEHGISPWATDRSGQTPIYHAEDAVIAQALVEAAISDPEFLASDAELISMPDGALRAIYVNSRSRVHTSPLLSAVGRANNAFGDRAKAAKNGDGEAVAEYHRAMKESNALVTYLSSLKASDEVFDSWGECALGSAAKLGNRDLVEILCEAGASPDNFRAYHQPMIFDVKDPVVAQMLIDHGADITTAYMAYGGVDGKTSTYTAAEAAEAHGNTEVAAVIREALAE